MCIVPDIRPPLSKREREWERRESLRHSIIFLSSNGKMLVLTNGYVPSPSRMNNGSPERRRRLESASGAGNPENKICCVVLSGQGRDERPR